MRALEATLAMQSVLGAPTDATLIAMAKDAYVRGDTEIEQLESTVDAILRGRPVGLLQPGERVLTRRHPKVRDLKVRGGGGFACVCPQCDIMRARGRRDAY